MLRPYCLLSSLIRHVRGRARAVGAEVHPAALAREGDEILQRLDPGFRVRHQQQARARNDADESQILVHVVAGILHHQPVHDVGGRDRAQDGVAVGLGAGDLRRADRAGGAGLVLDDDGLSGLLGDEFAIGAREQIGLAAGGIAANHANLPRRPGALRCALRRGAAHDERHRECSGAGGDEVAAIEFGGHDSLPDFAEPTASGRRCHGPQARQIGALAGFIIPRAWADRRPEIRRTSAGYRERGFRAPDAAQRSCSGALLSRGLCRGELCGVLGPGSAERTACRTASGTCEPY